MFDRRKKLPARFYCLASGREPVREWFLSLPIEDRRIVGKDVQKVEYAWPLGMPVCRPLSNGLWEVRSSLTNSRIARVLFAISDGRMVLLHAFIKKSQKTPADDLALARRRQQEIDA
jgi:phage-related protein